MQDYTCEIGACLLQLRERQDSGVQARMQTLTLEALTLTGRTMLTPANHRAIVNGRLDDASPVGQKPGKAFYQGVLVSRLVCKPPHLLCTHHACPALCDGSFQQ